MKSQPPSTQQEQTAAKDYFEFGFALDKPIRIHHVGEMARAGPQPQYPRLYDFLESLDQMATDYIAEHLEEMEDPWKDCEEEDFFYFRKFADGSYSYHLFPELNLSLIENPDFMVDFDRWAYK